MLDEKDKKSESERSSKPTREGVIQAVPGDGKVIEYAEVAGSVNPLLTISQEAQTSGSEECSDGKSGSSESSKESSDTTPEASAESDSIE